MIEAEHLAFVQDHYLAVRSWIHAIEEAPPTPGRRNGLIALPSVRYYGTATTSVERFTERYYRPLRAWVLHNDRHHRAVGTVPDTPVIAFEDFISQYDGLGR